MCQSTLLSAANVSEVLTSFFFNRNLKNLLLEGNTIESLPLELGEYGLKIDTLSFKSISVDLNIGVKYWGMEGNP